MSDNNFADIIKECKGDPNLPTDSVGDDIFKILKGLGVQACKSEEYGGCVSVDGLVVEMEKCVSGSSSIGCESLALNFSNTIKSKNIIIT